jgi:hypothetical protein
VEWATEATAVSGEFTGKKRFKNQELRIKKAGQGNTGIWPTKVSEFTNPNL